MICTITYLIGYFFYTFRKMYKRSPLCPGIHLNAPDIGGYPCFAASAHARRSSLGTSLANRQEAGLTIRAVRRAAELCRPLSCKSNLDVLALTFSDKSSGAGAALAAGFKCTDHRTRGASLSSFLDAHEPKRLGRNFPDEGIESFEPNWPLHGRFGTRSATRSACRVWLRANLLW